MKKQINLAITVEAVLLVDEDLPHDTDLRPEVAYQISFDDAIEYEVTRVVVVGP